MEAVKQLAVACNQQLRARRRVKRNMVMRGNDLHAFNTYLVWRKVEDYWIARGKKLFNEMREQSWQEPNFINYNL